MSDNSIVTPVGRIVQGNAFVPNTTDQQGNQLLNKSGPNKGQPRVEFYLGLAIAKDNPEWAALWASISAIASNDWPGGEFNAPTFSWKYIDGDSVDNKGKPYSDREGFAGHHILRFSSGYQPQVVTAGGAAQISEPSQCKRGDYARVVFTCKGNGNAEKPGVYMNLQIVEHIGYGEEITSGPDAVSILSQAQPAQYMPAGVSQTPVAPAITPAVAQPAVAQPASGSTASGSTASGSTASGSTASGSTASGSTASGSTASGATYRNFTTWYTWLKS